ncbi:MAG: class A beta-lactamase-related serine hydrolase [Bacteroidia bacterium]|nr:MAG: class A beta-lactamase-related serine hydrolase [Bacteroidia bacterium]
MKKTRLMMKNRIIILLSLLILLLAPLPAQDTEIWKDPRANLDLLNFLDAKMITGFNVESDLSFQFWKGTFPELEVNSPATMKNFLGGEYSIDVRWFDTYLLEVDTLLRPGRYGYYAEITGANGIVVKKAGTFFCTPDDWMGWSEPLQSNINYFPFDSIPESVWEENRAPISDYGGQILLKSIVNNQDGGILMSFIHDMHLKKLNPGPLHTPVIMDGDYHIRLKQKVMGMENTYPPLALPEKSNRPATVVHLMEGKEQEKNASFEEEMRALCIEWAEVSGEPFDMLVAKDGSILFHGAFGENLRGKFTEEEPTEIASITKLYTGLLFAQFVDQGLIGIDDPVGKYLPDFPSTGEKEITLRQCFTHTSGFYGHGSLGGVQNPWLDNSLALWLPYLEPGTRHYYNGMGYNLAGKVMEIVSGKSIFHLMHEYLFGPLQLQHTQLDIDLAYGIRSTAYDMAVVGQMLLNKGSYGNLRFFSEKTFESLLPVELETYFPEIKGKAWGIGMTYMNRYAEDEKSGEKRAILSDQIVGHGSATSSVLNVDLKNGIVITQSRMNGGAQYDRYLNKAYLLIEKYYSTPG